MEAYQLPRRAALLLTLALFIGARHAPVMAAAPAPQRPSNEQLVNTFPFSACTARNVSSTPYRLTGPPVLTSTDPKKDEVTYCFGVINSAPVAEPNPCAAMVLNKIEFIIGNECVAENPRGVKLVTVNGVPLSPSYGSIAFGGITYGLMSFSQLSSIFPVFPSGGLSVCLVFRASTKCNKPELFCDGPSCVYSMFNTERSCCPASQIPEVPPPPPPPPLVPAVSNRQPPASYEFPLGPCALRTYSGPAYTLTNPVGPVNVTATDATYCFTVSANPSLDPAATCAGMTLNKLDFLIKPECAQASTVRAATVNGRALSPSFSTKVSNGVTTSMMALSGLEARFPTVPANGLYVCMALRKGICDSPQKLCLGDSCKYATYNADRSCCPTGDFYP